MTTACRAFARASVAACAAACALLVGFAAAAAAALSAATAALLAVVSASLICLASISSARAANRAPSAARRSSSAAVGCATTCATFPTGACVIIRTMAVFAAGTVGAAVLSAADKSCAGKIPLKFSKNTLNNISGLPTSLAIVGLIVRIL